MKLLEEFNPFKPLPLREQQAVEKYFQVEEVGMAAPGYAESKRSILRERALSLIAKLRIVKVLQWRMCTVTAFCFVQYFFSKVPGCSFTRRIIHEIIIQAQGDIKFTKFKPSIIAAASFLVAALNSGIDQEYETVMGAFEVDDKLDQNELQLCKVDLNHLHQQLIAPRPANEPDIQEIGRDNPFTGPMQQQRIQQIQEQEEEQNMSGMNVELKWKLGVAEEDNSTLDPSLFEVETGDSNVGCWCCHVM